MRTFLLLALLSPRAAPQEPDPFQGLWKPVDLNLENVETRAAFEALFEKAGMKLELPPTIAEKKLSYRAKGVPFWEAVDDLCRLNGNLRHPRKPFENDPQLQSSAWVEYPAAYRGPFRMSVFDVARVREFRYPGRGDRTDVTFVLQWTPPFEPVTEFLGLAGRIRVARIEDDTGKSLLPQAEIAIDFELGRAGYRKPSCFWPLRIQPAAAGAGKISRIDVEWEGAFLRDVEEIVFENPAESVGAVRRVGPLSVVLASFEKEKGALADDEFPTHEFVLRVSFDPEAPGGEWKKSLKEFPLPKRLLKTARVTLVKPGQGLQIRQFDLDDRKAGETSVDFHGSVTLGGEKRATAIALRVAKGMGSAKTTFMFKDVPLPGESR